MNNENIFLSERIQLDTYFDSSFAFQTKELKDVQKILEAELRVAAEPVVGAAVLLQAVHGHLAAILIAAHVDHEAVGDRRRELEGGGGQLAGTQRAYLAVHELFEPALAEHAEAHPVAPPIRHQVRELLQAAFVAQALDVADVGNRCYQFETHIENCRQRFLSLSATVGSDAHASCALGGRFFQKLHTLCVCVLCVE